MAAEEHRHADDEALEQYSMGSLQEPELGQLEEHLLICGDCRERLTQMDSYVRGMRAAGKRLRKEKESS